MQYEVDGSTETHDPAEPWTTSCPYLPGQAVNTLVVPVEQTLRQRSGSLSSVCPESFRTMDPEAKFTAPRPVPAPLGVRRLGSASSILQKRPPSRSPSPAPSWKRFFTRRLASRDSDQSSTGGDLPAEQNLLSHPSPSHTRCSTPLSEGSRARDIDHDSLRRFLSEVAPVGPRRDTEQPPALSMPDEIGDEVDDDDNFATSAISENQAYATSLSPPPLRRSPSLDTVPRVPASASSITLAAGKPPLRHSQDGPSTPTTALPRLETNQEPRWSLSAASSALVTPISPYSIEEDPSSFYDSNDEDDVVSSTESDNFSHQPVARMSFASRAFNYSLPRQCGSEKTMAKSSPAIKSFNSPHLGGTDSGSAQDGGTNLLGVPIDTGLDDFISEMGWIVRAIGADDH